MLQHMPDQWGDIHCIQCMIGPGLTGFCKYWFNWTSILPSTLSWNFYLIINSLLHRADQQPNQPTRFGAPTIGGGHPGSMGQSFKVLHQSAPRLVGCKGWRQPIVHDWDFDLFLHWVNVDIVSSRLACNHLAHEVALWIGEEDPFQKHNSPGWQLFFEEQLLIIPF